MIMTVPSYLKRCERDQTCLQVIDGSTYFLLPARLIKHGLQQTLIYQGPAAFGCLHVCPRNESMVWSKMINYFSHKIMGKAGVQ